MCLIASHYWLCVQETLAPAQIDLLLKQPSVIMRPCDTNEKGGQLAAEHPVFRTKQNIPCRAITCIMQGCAAGIYCYSSDSVSLCQCRAIQPVELSKAEQIYASLSKTFLSGDSIF